MDKFIQPTREVDYRDAERRLKLWLKGQDMGIENCYDWTKWDFKNRPFWSVWGLVYGTIMNNIGLDHCGIHIYDDGEITIVVRNLNLDQINISYS